MSTCRQSLCKEIGLALSYELQRPVAVERRPVLEDEVGNEDLGEFQPDASIPTGRKISLVED